MTLILEVDMDLVLLIFAFAFTMAEYLCVLRGLGVKVKRFIFIGYGLAILIAINLIFGEIVKPDLEGYYGIRVAFVTIIFMIDKEKFSEKVQNVFLAAIMKDCLLLAVETWFIEASSLYGTSYKNTIIFYCLELLTVFVFGEILRRGIQFFNRDKIIKIGNLLDYIIIFGCFDIFRCLWWVYREIVKGNFTLFTDKLYTSIACVSLVLLEINILYKKWLAEQVQRYAKAEHELYETQKHYYQSLLEKEADTKKYRHDMNNHMICIKSLLDEGNYEELQNYIDNLHDRTSFLVNKGHKTGNSILDALTNYYADNMGSEIDFSVKGNIVKRVDIDDTALSSIYSNMLVNAIEAQKGITPGKNKFIHVSLKEGDKFAQLIVKNSMEKERIEDLDNIKTTKSDKENHGFGLANIRKNVTEHNGKLIIEAEDYEFCVKATLPLASA